MRSDQMNPTTGGVVEMGPFKVPDIASVLFLFETPHSLVLFFFQPFLSGKSTISIQPCPLLCLLAHQVTLLPHRLLGLPLTPPPLLGSSIRSIPLVIYQLSLHSAVHCWTISIWLLTSKISKCCPSDTPDLIHLCHYQRELRHFHFPLFSSSSWLGGNACRISWELEFNSSNSNHYFNPPKANK